MGDGRAPTAEDGLAVGAGLLSISSKGFSILTANSSPAVAGLIKRQSSGKTTGVLSVSSKDSSKLSSRSIEEPRSKLSSS